MGRRTRTRKKDNDKKKGQGQEKRTRTGMLPIFFIRDGENVVVRLVIAVIVSDCS